MKSVIAFLISAALLLSMTGCAAHEHEWGDATCTQPKMCSVCGETEGEMLEHEWNEATCEQPKTCDVCGETEGTALEHIWSEANCTTPKTCSLCEKTDGKKLGHNWIEATLSAPKTCERCGETTGTKLLLENTCDDVLARATYNGHEYVFVKNEREDYSGVYVEVGIIKDNAWLMEPTPDMPFVAIKVWESDVPSAGRVEYLGHGCFVCTKRYSSSSPLASADYRYIFYDIETGRTYATKEGGYYLPLGGTESDEYCIVERLGRRFTLLNKATFETKTIEIRLLNDGRSVEDYCAISEGLFWACEHVANWISSSAFYDTNGNIAIDLSDHDILPYQNLEFINGKCSIKTRVNNGTGVPSYYRIVIDKTGNVIQSEKISESEAYD